MGNAASRQPLSGSHAPAWRTFVSACAVTFVAVGSSAGAALLKPDVQVLNRGPVRLCQEAPNPLHKADKCRGSGRVVLRASTFIGNGGPGPLEYAPAPPALDTPKDCHGDGDVDVDGDGIPDDNDVVVVQRIYQDGNGNGTFERGSDTNFSPSVVGCRYFHPAHNHYHVEGFAELALRSDSTGQIVRTGDKISFCVADSGIFDGGLPGTPQRAFYSETGCTERLSIQGTSVGWYDLYAWGLPGQQLDVTGIPAGNYCLIVEGDPQNLLQESNEANNNRFFHVFVDPAQAPRDAYKTLKPLRTPCPA